MPVNWARLVSLLLSPPPVWALMAVPVALRDAETTAQGLRNAGLYGLLVSLLPMLYVALMVRRGEISSLDMPPARSSAEGPSSSPSPARPSPGGFCRAAARLA